MAMITNNQYGVVGVNSNVLCKMIIDEMLIMENHFTPCSRKGKPLKKGLFTGYNEMMTSVEIKEEMEKIEVQVYLLARRKDTIEEKVEELFDQIEADFATLRLDRPVSIRARVLGILGKQVTPLDMEVSRQND